MDIDFLTDDEWDALTPAQQSTYLDLLEVEKDEWRLQPHQQIAYDLADQVDDLLFGGSAGPGKSEMLLFRAWRKSLEIPNHHTLIIRATIPRLKQTLIRRSFERFDHKQAKWRATDKVWSFANGSLIQFGHCEVDDDVAGYLSAQYDMLLIDELTEMTEYMYRMLRSRVRTTREKERAGARPHAVSASNPGQRGHMWVKKEWIDPSAGETAAWEEPVKDYQGNPVLHPDTGEPMLSKHGFVPGLPGDNVFLGATYQATLAALPETEQRMYMFGDWDVFEGQFFSSFRKDVHTFDPGGVTIPREWPRIVGIDYGGTAPFCALWAAIDWDGRPWVYREIYQAGLEAEEQARMVLQMSKHSDGTPEKLVRVLADPSVFNRSMGPKSPTIAARWREQGLKASPANNDRVNGWARIRSMLRNDPDGKIPFDPRTHAHTPGVPGIFFSTACRDTLRTLPSLPRDKNNPEDLDTKSEDHAADALRYLAGHLARTPRRRAQIRDRKLDRIDDDGPERGMPLLHPLLGRLG